MNIKVATFTVSQKSYNTGCENKIKSLTTFQVNGYKKEVLWPDQNCDDEYLTNWYKDVSTVPDKWEN